MKNIKPLSNLALVLIVIVAACKAPKKNKYSISSNIDSSELKYEKAFPPEWQKREDSMNKKLNLKPLTKGEKEYLENMKNDVAIIYVYQGDSLIKPRTLGQEKVDFTRALSRAIYENDTLKITVGVGFFGYAGVVINIHGNEFNGKFFEGGDGHGFLKYNKTDTSYVNYLQVDAINETLVLNKKPPSGSNAILIGEYDGTFKTFYEKNVGEVEEIKVRWKIIFKCAI